MNRSNKFTVALAAGGTGGHLFPALALAEAMIEQKVHPLLVCDQRTKEFVSGEFAKIDSIKIFAPKPTPNIFKKIYNCFKLIFAVFHVYKFLKISQAKAVIGFGGYPSFPTLIAAILLRLPIYIHEQNAVMGRVNRMFARIAKNVFLSFENTLKVPKNRNKKSIITGNLIRKNIVNNIKPKNFDNNNINLLVIGGSQGSKLLSEVVPQAIQRLDISLQKTLSIHQQSAYPIIPAIEDLYAKTSCKSIVIRPFFDDIGALMKSADLVICRAGASTVCEVAIMQLPAVFVPLKIARDNHQYYNAKHLADKGAAYIVNEDDFNENTLASLLNDLLNQEKLKNMSIQTLSYGSTDIIINKIISDLSK